MGDIVSKSEYARLKGRTPAAVTHWITDKKLRAPALVLQDGVEMIDVDLADAQLAVELHPSQQAAQEKPIGAAAALAEGDDENADGTEPDEKTGRIIDADNQRFLKARADVKQAEAEGLVRKRQEETGKWLDAEAARAAFGKEMAASISEVEAWLLGPTAKMIAAELNVEAAAVVALMRREWRGFRERQAAAKRGGLAQAAE